MSCRLICPQRQRVLHRMLEQSQSRAASLTTRTAQATKPPAMIKVTKCNRGIQNKSNHSRVHDSYPRSAHVGSSSTDGVEAGLQARISCWDADAIQAACCSVGCFRLFCSIATWNITSSLLNTCQIQYRSASETPTKPISYVCSRVQSNSLVITQ